MRYCFLFMTIGLLLGMVGLTKQPLLFPALWLGICFIILGIAYGTKFHRVLGKRPDGSIALWSWLAFLPLHIYTTVVWHVMRIMIREPATNRITNQLVVGRRLLGSELAETFDNYVDLTAEFREPRIIRESPAYLSFAILDGFAPTPQELQTALERLHPGRTFIHCAQGHGRTGLFALAVLLNSGTVGSIEEGLILLRKERPAVSLTAAQMNCIRLFWNNAQQPPTRPR